MGVFFTIPESARQATGRRASTPFWGICLHRTQPLPYFPRTNRTCSERRLRGATRTAGTERPCTACFYPRPRVRGDWRGAGRTGSSGCFYPRPRVRGDSTGAGGASSSTCFYPRPRVRGDRRRRSVQCVRACFYPRPRVRGDAHLGHPTSRLASFYPRPRVRGDIIWRYRWPVSCRFLSTPPREGRPSISIKSTGPKWFLSTPPREGRLVAAGGM